jgi:hypothetical protein
LRSDASASNAPSADRLDVKRERRLQINRHRQAAGHADQGVVEEPRRAQVDELVAGIADGPERHRQRAERARREKDVLLLERDAGLRAQPRRRGCQTGRLVVLVREPVLVLGLRVARERFGDAGQRHVVGVSEHEVADLGIAHTLRVARREHKLEEPLLVLGDPAEKRGVRQRGHRLPPRALRAQA